MSPAPLQTSAEPLDKNRVKLRVEVPEDALAPALERVYRRWANEIRVRGFRKGRVPRQLIDARVGADAVREEALRDALPELYLQALRSEDLEAVAPPRIEIVEFERGAPIVFEATIDVRPEIDVPDFTQLPVDAPEDEVTEADVDEQLERLRERFAELEPTAREARRGDFAVIDIKGHHGGELVEGVSAPDLLYEIGSRSGPPKLDEELEGTRPGAILKFTDTVPGEEGGPGREVAFTVLVKEIKSRRLPPLDDDFARRVGDYPDLQALRSELRERLAVVKRAAAAEEARRRVLEALVARATFEAPEVLVEEEFEHRLEHLAEDLRRQGLDVERYAQQLGMTELELRSELRRQVEQGVKAELLLEEIARREGVEVSDEELGREVALLAARTGREPRELAKQLAESGRLRTVAADIMRRKALDRVVAAVGLGGLLEEPGERPDEPEAEATEAPGRTEEPA